MAVDGLQRAEIARLRRLRAETGDDALLARIGMLMDELERSRPMPRRVGT